MKHNLPISPFRTVREIHYKWIERSDRAHIVLIAPDHNAGRDGRFSVIHLDLGTGRAEMIGRELDLDLARQVASDFLAGMKGKCEAEGHASASEPRLLYKSNYDD